MGLTKQQIVMVAVLLTGTLLAVLNQTLLSPALPSIMRDLNVEATTVQWLTSGYSMVEAIIIPLNAFLIGRFSTRKLFVGGIAWFSAGSLVAAMAPNFFVLLLGRIMQAMATGIVMPMVFTLIMLIFPREKRGSAMGVIGLIISFAPAVGPSVSGILVDSIGWRALFGIVTVLGIVVVIVAAFSLKNFEGFAKSTFDAMSVVLLLIGMFGLLYGLSTFTSNSQPLVSIAIMALGVVFLALFAKRQGKLENPLLNIMVLKTRRFRTAALLIALLQAALVGSGVVFPIFVQSVLGASATVSGLILFPGAVLGALMGLWAGRMFDKHGVRGLALSGGLILAASGIALAFFTMHVPVIVVCLVNTVMSLGIQLLVTPLNTWGVNSLDNKLIQHGNALSSTLNQVGASFGTALIVSLTALSGLFTESADPLVVTFTGNHVAFTGMCILLLVVVFGIVVFVRDIPRIDVKPVIAADEFAGTPGADRGWVVGDIMDREPGVIGDTATVRELVALMRERKTSGVPIVNKDAEVLGFVSDGDIMKYLQRSSGSYTDGTNFFSMITHEDLKSKVGELLDLQALRIATLRVVTVDAHEDIEEAFRLLAERHIKKLPVLLGGKLVGTLSRGNVITALEVADNAR